MVVGTVFIVERLIAAAIIILLFVVLRPIALSVLGICSASSTSSSAVIAVSTSTNIAVAAVSVALSTSASVAAVVVAAIGAWSGWVCTAIACVSLWLIGGSSRSGTATLLAKSVLLLALAGVLVDVHGVSIVHTAGLGVDDEANGVWGALAGRVAGLTLPVDVQGATIGL